MTPDQVFMFFEFEPCDAVTRTKLERVLKANCPGDYRVIMREDHSGFDIEFATGEAETHWLLTYGPIERT